MNKISGQCRTLFNVFALITAISWCHPFGIFTHEKKSERKWCICSVICKDAGKWKGWFFIQRKNSKTIDWIECYRKDRALTKAMCETAREREREKKHKLREKQNSIYFFARSLPFCAVAHPLTPVCPPNGSLSLSFGRVTYTYDVLACLWSWWRCF